MPLGVCWNQRFAYSLMLGQNLQRMPYIISGVHFTMTRTLEGPVVSDGRFVYFIVTSNVVL